MITIVPILTVCKFQTMYLSNICKKCKNFLFLQVKVLTLKGGFAPDPLTGGSSLNPTWGGGQDVCIKPNLEKDS